MSLASEHQDIIQFSNRKSSYPMTSNFISHFASWAKFWLTVNDKTIPHKRKLFHRSEHKAPHVSVENNSIIPVTQRAHLYRATCHKLRPNQSNSKKSFTLGDILHIRKFWENLENLIYQNERDYIPSVKRIPFNPDIPGSVYLPKKSRKQIVTNKNRQPYACSNIVYTFKHDIDTIETQPITSTYTHSSNNICDDDDDDDVPLAILHLSKPFIQCK
ncbi:hypothetical protein RMATCC62417_08367 [Rhizopus microsporus]|nr:hypothetical protein RMATCC62417_08367 [Rhizopus microsporus]